jgi:hypoxanthine phosphoribosyltransferase
MRLSDQPLISATAIQARVAALARQISLDYRGRDVVLIAVLKGASVFCADLMRAIEVPAALDYIRAKSYQGAHSNRPVEFTMLPETNLTGRHVVIVEDILDTGRTTAAILDALHADQPASLALCVLLDKPGRRLVPVKPAYIGFTIDDPFVVGYGLDFDEAHRHLPAIYTMVEGDAV